MFEQKASGFISILRVPRNKKALNTIKLLKNVSIPIEINIDRIDLSNISTLWKLDTTTPLSLRTLRLSKGDIQQYFMYGNKQKIFASKRDSINQLIKIIESHTEMLGFKVSKVVSIFRWGNNKHLSNILNSEAIKIERYIDMSEPRLMVSIYIPNDTTQVTIDHIKRSIKHNNECKTF